MPYLLCFFSLTTRFSEKITEYNRKQQQKKDKVLMLAKSKLNSIETLVSQALIDMEISHKKIFYNFKEKKINMRRWKTI